MSTFTNRLSKEQSPYLLQHAHNPVDWYPWGDEAFKKAVKENKPVFLSIGYSTCHWCHVMEEESFSDPATAAVLNKSFIAIKVDREERPDIDSVYMGYVTAVTGSGGWPLNVFLLPDKKPFYGGTYFPPEPRYSMPGFKGLLSSIAESWNSRRQEIQESADSAVQFLQNVSPGGPSPVELSASVLEEAFRRFDANFDEQLGGFGGAPKFPRSHALSMLLRYWRRTRNERAIHLVERTLEAMASGGLYDQLGGGFHRYSTDAQWRVPHFEKMLYDQAILARTYLEAYQATRKDLYARIARETLDYVSLRMTGPDGAFLSAQDADSEEPEEGHRKREGAYFVWKKSQIEKVMTFTESEMFCFVHGVTPAGNVKVDPHGDFAGKNILFRAHTVEEAAAQFEKSVGDVRATLERAREKLLKTRDCRPEPHLDDKVLTDWNGLMIAAFAAGAVALDEPRYVQAAYKAAEMVQTKLVDNKGHLLHRYRAHSSAIEATLNDHAFLIYGYLALYEASMDPKWLLESKKLADRMLELFWDKDEGGFFLTSEHAEKLIVRPKEFYDGALPSGNSIAALALLLLGRFTGDRRYEERAEATLKAILKAMGQEPANCPQALIALDFLLGPSREIVVAGPSKDPAAMGMLREIYSRFIPNKIVLFHDGPGSHDLEKVAPFVRDKRPTNGKTTVYVCRNHACQRPVTDKDALRMLLNDPTEN